MANKNLSNAKNAKNDEFYTQLNDIQAEVNAYIDYDPDVFRGKTVLLPCDDPEWSNFTRFFAQNFERFGLKKLISTSYAAASKNISATKNTKSTKGKKDVSWYQPSLFEQESPQYDEDKTAVKCIINGGALTDAEGKDLLSFDLSLWDMFGGKQGMFGYEALPVMVRTSFVPFDSITDEWNRMKMKSFYVSKDITDPLLEPEAVEEMLIMYPILAADAFSILDPMAKARELAELLRIGFEFGLVNEETILDSTTVVLPMSDISKLPAGTELYFDNLSVEYVN